MEQGEQRNQGNKGDQMEQGNRRNSGRNKKKV